MKLIRVAALAAIGAALAAGPATAEMKELNFGIISTESTQNLKTDWVPFTLSVANKQVDVATNNNESLGQLKKNFPDKFAQIRVVWTSPLIPADPIVWRADLPAETKAKAFFVDYGVKGSNVAAEKKVLAGLQWASFKVSSNNQLLPIRQLELFKVRSKIAADDKLDDAEKKAKLADLDAKLAELQKASPKPAPSSSWSSSPSA